MKRINLAHLLPVRNFLLPLFLVAVLFLFPFFRGDTVLADDSNELVVLTVGGGWLEVTKEVVAKPFIEKYGAKVIYDIRPNTEQLMAVAASKNNPMADIIELSMGRIARGTMMGLLAEQDEKNVPNRKHIPKVFKTNFYAARAFGPIVLVFNKEKVDEKDITSWDVLKNPKYKNRVAIMKFGWMGEQFLHGVNKVKGGTYADATPGLNFCKAVLNNGGIVINSNDHMSRVFESGEVWIAPYFTARTENLITKGVPLKYKFVPGSVMYEVGFCAVKNAKNLDLAYKWINMSLDPEIQKNFAIKRGFAPTNKAVQLPPEASKVKFSNEQINKIAELNRVEIAKNTDKNLERWNIEVLKK